MPLPTNRAARLVAAALVAVLLVMTAAPAAQASPNISTILRKAPTSERTDADTLTWLITFTEPVINVSSADFAVSGTTATLALQPLALDEEECSEEWDATLSGGDLEDLEGTVTLTIADNYYIWGCLGDGEEMTHPGPKHTNHNTFVVDNGGEPPPTPTPTPTPTPSPTPTPTSSPTPTPTPAPTSAPRPSTPRPSPPTPTPSPIIGATPAGTAIELADDLLVLRRHDQPGVEVQVGIGRVNRDGRIIRVVGFIRDADLGQTYAVVRRESDDQVVRRWVPPDSPLVYRIPWSIVNTQYTFPVGVILAIPLDDQHPPRNMLTRRFDGGDDRVLAYDAGLGQWRHVPDIPTFQALSFYWCNVTAADARFFDRITLGPPLPASDVPARPDYPACLT